MIILIDFIKKTCYISVPILISTFLMVLFILNKFLIKYNFNITDKISTIIGIVGTLIGFLLTAITIFSGIPKDNQIFKKVIRYNHHIIFSKCVLLGILFSSLTMFIWIIGLSDKWILLGFTLSFSETIMASWYIYKFSIFSLK